MVHSSGHDRRAVPRLALLAIVMAIGVAPANAQSAVGFQGGGSIDPEQGFVGVFWQSPDIAGRFRIRPGIDGGFGSDLRVATINVDFLYVFPLGQSGWRLVQGGGPVIAITRFDFGFDQTETDTSAGASYVLGFQHDSGFFTEFRGAGGGRVPSLKFGAGWMLKID
jgi:hypothetical protein